MNKFYIIILLIGLASMFNTSWAQLDPKKLTHFPELDGTMIHDVISDQYGVLWIATQSGLVTFDGNDYTRYHPDKEDSTTMGTILTFKLYEDPNGFIWIGCMDAIYQYNPVTKLFKRFPFDHLINFPEYGQPSVYTIAPGSQGRIYFGISSFIGAEGSDALVYYDKNEGQLKQFEYPDSLTIKNVYKSANDPIGNIWLLTFSGAFKLDTNQMLTHIPEISIYNAETDNFINGIQIDSQGILWMINTKKQLISFDPETRKLEFLEMGNLFVGDFTNSFPMDMEFDHNGNIWFTSNQGLIFFDRKKEKFEIFENSKTDRLRNGEINSLHFDSFKNLWMGCQNVGLLKYNDRTLLNSIVHNVNNEGGLTYGWVNKILETEDGTIWIATPGGINSFNPVSGTIKAYPSLSLHPELYSLNILAEISPNEILIESNLGRGILNVRKKTFNLNPIKDIPDSISINNVIKDSFGTMWYATNNGVYTKKEGSSTVLHFDLTEYGGIATFSNAVTKLLESNKYGIWIISNYGLFCYDYNTKQIVRHAYEKDKGDVLSSHDINAIYEDPEGIVWLGTWQGGLCRYNPETRDVKIYSIEDGLPSTSIQGILANENQRTLWLSTFAGISQFSIEKEEFSNFSLADGIQGLLYTDGAALETSNGYFIFGGNNGITYFNPKEISKGSIPPKVYISEFKVADKPVDISKKNSNKTVISEVFELSHFQNNVSFDYIGIQYDNPQKNRFAYILENYDLTWREVGNLRSAFYYNLPSGTYTFRVKAANSNGIWNEEGASISFFINPPWWKTWLAYMIYGILLVGTIIAIDRIQRKRLAERANRQAKEKELKQAKEIEKAYTKLKATQSQLVHAEKMASLGELTTGIAHEIQNPLNFVNNFSEVNAELISELKEEVEKGDYNEVKAIADDIAENEQKILHHGKRADAIVKGMLQHSRTSSNEKEPTDINTLADEYLRLAYHGMRAKDKSFNAGFKTEFDENLPKINVVGQDIARVMLNLINNAFFACAERSRSTVSAKASTTTNPDYKPLVTIGTKKINGQVEISVKDNGMGIPENILDKIFQPFFTTKPTGEGTGLGLSLSYDIITKGHGGNLKVETNENEGTNFIIQLNI